MLKPSTSKILLAVIGLALSVGAAWLAVRGAELDGVGSMLGDISWPLLVAGGAVVLVANIARAWRWAMLLGPRGRSVMPKLFSAIMIGYLANLVLPVRAGDVVRVASIRRSAGLAPAQAAASILAERLLDVVTLAVVLAVVSVGITLPSYLGTLIILITAGSLVLLVGMVVVGVFNRKLRVFLVDVAGRWSNRPARILLAILLMFVRGLEPLSNRRVFLSVLTLSMFIRLAEVVSIALAVASTGIEFPLRASALLNSVVTLGLLIPSGPGAIGSFELLSVVVFEIFENGRSVALTAALVIHGMGIGVTVLIGTPLLIREIILRAGNITANRIPRTLGKASDGPVTKTPSGEAVN